MAMKSQQLITLQLPQPANSVELNPQTNTADPLLPGRSCPECGKGKLDYNGLLELECPLCGFRSGGGEGCT